MKERKEAKATLLTIGGSMIVWGIQMGLQAQYIEAAGGILVAGILFWTYEYLTQIENNELLNEFIGHLDDEVIQKLIDDYSDDIREIIENTEDVSTDSNTDA